MADQIQGKDLTTIEKQTLQKVVGKDNLTGNPQLPESTFAPGNYQLVTSRKNIIQAINELFDKITAAQKTVGNFTTRFNAVVGDEENTDSSIFKKIQETEPNIIRYLLALHEKLDAIELDEGTGTEGPPGLSAFEVWKALPGNDSKDIDDFWNFIGDIAGGSTGGITLPLDYNTDLINLPQINGVDFKGNVALPTSAISNLEIAALFS